MSGRPRGSISSIRWRLAATSDADVERSDDVELAELLVSVLKLSEVDHDESFL